MTTETTYKNLISNIMRTLNTKNLPDTLVYFPLYMIGVIKHRVCCKDEILYKLDYDLSNYLRIKLLKINNYEIMSFIYPRVYSLSECLIDETLGEYNNGVINMPAVNYNFNLGNFNL